MFKQIDEKYGNDGRVVLAAIKTDGGGITGAKAYLRGKINPDNWIIASDTNATHYKATVGKVGLFEYALIGPDGEIVEISKAGSKYTSGPNVGKYVPSTNRIIDQVPNAKSNTGVLAKDFPPAFHKAIRTAEWGDMAGALRMLKPLERKETTKDQAVQLKEAITTNANTSVAKWKAVLDNDSASAADRFSAYMALENASKTMRGLDAGTAARDAVRAAAKDKDIKRENYAKRSFDSVMAKVARLRENQRNQQLMLAMGALAKKYKGTVYGDMAKEEYLRIAGH